MVAVPSGAYGVVDRPYPILNLHGVWFCQLSCGKPDDQAGDTSDNQRTPANWKHVRMFRKAADAQSRLVRQRIPTSLKGLLPAKGV